jgi:hypothetical protein
VSITIPGLSVGEQDVLTELVNTLEGKRRRNRLRERYYDSKQVIQQLGIAIPPQMAMLETVVGWPAKAVDILDRRVNFEGLVVSGESSGPFGLDEVFADNCLEVESSQAHTAAFKYSCSFLTVTKGDVASGDPDVLITPRSAMDTTALWDSRRRQLRAALSVTARDGEDITGLILYLPDRVIVADKLQRGWVLQPIVKHSLGRVPVAILPYKPDLDRPFGKSKISRAVMSLTDQAVRTMLRTEIAAEFFSVPQRYILGADESSFVGPNGEPRTGWEVTIGKVTALPLNEVDDKPTVGQFPQMSMQPHSEMLRSIASMFAGESNIPVNSLGIIHDNPASDAAMQTAYLDLVQDAERCHTTFGAGYVTAGQLAVMVRDNLDAVPTELKRMRAKFRDASTGTKFAATQAVMAQIAGGVLPPESEVTLEALGYDDVTIERIVSDRKRAGAGGRLQQLLDIAKANPAQAGAEAVLPSGEDPAALRQKFEALGVAIRAGVDPASAAVAIGLPSLKFTGAVPVSLRLPESEASGLEDASGGSGF